jgi:hypothetical protein
MDMATTKPQRPFRPKTAGNGVPLALNRLRTIQAEIAELVQQLAPEKAKEDGGPRTAVREAATEAGQIETWADDPFLEAVAGAEPVAADPVTSDLPHDDQPLQSQIREQEPPPEIYTPDKPQFLYWNAASALARGINFWNPLLPSGTQWSAMQQPLQVELDAGEDFNAFYARESGLNFFHGTVDRVDPNSIVYSGASPDVICHELGHAILDAVKPELFDAMSMEVGALHEAFGDISSMLCALQLSALRDYVLDQTRGELNANSRLSQRARQLGWAIRVELDPSAVDSDCLRNCCNKFFYQDPAGLPPSAPATQLSSEVHSFSRVFSGAFLDVLARMYRIGPANAQPNPSDNLLAISHDAGKLLIEGARLASVGAGFYSQVAAGMIQADQSLNGGRYRTAISSSFVQRGILSPAAAVSLGRDLQAHGGQGFGVARLAGGARQIQFEGDNEGYKKTGKDVPALPLRPLTMRFGVTFHVHLPAEPNRFAVAPAAITGGSGRTYSPEDDAHSFIEDLIQLDRISDETVPGAIPAELVAPHHPGARETPRSSKTHHLVREDGRTVLKRHHFDCCCYGRR